MCFDYGNSTDGLVTRSIEKCENNITLQNIPYVEGAVLDDLYHYCIEDKE